MLLGVLLPPGAPSIAQVLRPNSEVSLPDVIRSTRSPNIRIVPSEAAAAALEAQLIGTAFHDRLASALQRMRGETEFVVIDTPPHLGPLSILGFVACDWILAAAQTHRWSFQALEMLETYVRDVRRAVGRPHVPLRVLRTMMRRNVAHDREIADAIARKYGERSFATIVTLAAALQDATTPADGQGTTVLWRFPTSTSAAQYRALAEEVLTWVASEFRPIRQLATKMS